MAKTGTKEWSAVSRNILLGCRDCRYCYARADALRYHRIQKAEEWLKPRVLLNQLKNTGKASGRIMFPSTHDLLPEFMVVTENFIGKNLRSGNEMLLVSKPNEPVIRRLCDQFMAFRDQITWRFTIGSADERVLRFWESAAPGYGERLASLRYAFDKGYRTSVSCEPYLDDTICHVVSSAEPFVTDSIWIGKMNRFEHRVDTTGWRQEQWDFWRGCQAAQTDEAIWKLYERFKGNEKVKWKDSCKKVLGLPEEEIG